MRLLRWLQHHFEPAAYTFAAVLGLAVAAATPFACR